MHLLALVLFATQASFFSFAPTYPYEISDLDYKAAYQSFFKVQELIKKININRFDGFKNPEDKDTFFKGRKKKPAPVFPTGKDTFFLGKKKKPAPILPDLPSSVINSIPEIDLTEEAIQSDTAGIPVVKTVPEVKKTTTAVIKPETTRKQQTITTTLPTTTTITTTLPTTTTHKPTTTLTTTHPTTRRTTHPTTIRTTNPTTTTKATTTTHPTTTTTITTTPTTTTPTTTTPPKVILKDVTTERAVVPRLPDPIEDEALNTIDTSDNIIIDQQTHLKAKKFGYKILLKKIGGKKVPVGKIKFTFPTIVEKTPVDTKDDDNIELITDAPEAVIPKAIEKEVLKEQNGDIVEEEEEEEEQETTTELNLADFLPEPIIATIPEIPVDIDENVIAKGVMKISEDAQEAIKEIMNQTANEVIVFENCSAPVTEVEGLLVDLARRISGQTDNLNQIVNISQSIKDETSLFELSKSGATLLRLVDPFLESIVPKDLNGSCAGSSSEALSVSLAGLATELDVIGSKERDIVKADKIHKTATSLQIAAWALTQLQTSVKGFYGSDGICGGNSGSSTPEILGSLSQAIAGYIPIVKMLGNEASTRDLQQTIAALTTAKEDIKALEKESGKPLPGVKCGATFAEMADQLEDLADFVEVIEVIAENDIELEADDLLLLTEE